MEENGRNSEKKRLADSNNLLFKIKFRYVISILFSGVLICYILTFYLQDEIPFWSQIIKAIGDSLVVAIIVGLTFEWFLKKESKMQIYDIVNEAINEVVNEKIRPIFHEEITNISNYNKNEIINRTDRLKDDIIQSLLIDKSVMRELMKSEKLDEIICSGIEVKLNDQDMGNDVYNSILKEIFKPGPRWKNVFVKTILMEIEDEDVIPEIKNQFYYLEDIFRYETRLNKDSFIFRCVSNLDDFKKSISNEDDDCSWLNSVAPKDFDYFHVHEIEIDGLKLKKNIKKHMDESYTISCTHPNLNERIGKNVIFNFSFRTLMEKESHIYFQHVARPSNKVTVIFDYGKTNIKSVKVRDFFITTKKPKIDYLPRENEEKTSVEIYIDDWVFPRSGVVFAWRF